MNGNLLWMLQNNLNTSIENIFIVFCCQKRRNCALSCNMFLKGKCNSYFYMRQFLGDENLTYFLGQLTGGTFILPLFRGKAAAADVHLWSGKAEMLWRDASDVRRRTTAVTGRGSQTQISIKDCAEFFTKITDFFGTQRKVSLALTPLCHKRSIPLHRRDTGKRRKGCWLPLSAREIIFFPLPCATPSLCLCVCVYACACICVCISALTKWRNFFSFFKRNK